MRQTMQGFVGISVVFMLFASVLSADQPRGFMIEAEDFDGLDQYPFWKPVKGAWYAKEQLGGYISGGGYAVANVNSLGAVMETTFDRELPPGKYNVWLKVAIAKGTDDAVEVEIDDKSKTYAWRRGGVEGETNPDIHVKGRGYRWIPGQFKIENPAKNIRIKALKANTDYGDKATPEGAKPFLVVDAVYIGPADEKLSVENWGRSGEGILFGEVDAGLPAQDPGQEVSATEAAQLKGNLLENSSFEAGIAHGWATVSMFEPLTSTFLDDSTAVNGRHSLCSVSPDMTKPSNGFLSKPYMIHVPGKYTLSAWLRSEDREPVSLSVSGIDWRLSKRPRRTPGVIAGRFVPTNEWHRFSATGDLAPGVYDVSIAGPGHFWVDAVQLEKAGEPTQYRPLSHTEAGLGSDIPGKIYFPGGKTSLDLAVACDTNTLPRKAQVTCTVYDIWDRVVTEKKVIVKRKPGQQQTMQVDLIPPRTGIFRAVTEIEGCPGTRDEFVFSVLPEPRTMGIDHGSSLGLFPHSSEYMMAACQRAGIKWYHSIRDKYANWFREKEQGKIEWFDEEIACIRDHGVEPMLMLDTYGGLPKWVEPSPANKRLPADMSLWASFVERMVEHYKDKVKYWILSDDVPLIVTAEEYGQWLKITYETAKKVDPDCVIVGWNYHKTSMPGWEEAFKKYTLPYCDIVFHGNRVIREKYHRAVQGYAFGSSLSMYDYMTFGDPEKLDYLRRGRRARIRDRYCVSLCNYSDNMGGLDQFLYYQAHFAYKPSQASISKSAFEYCGSLTAGTVMARMLDYFTRGRRDCAGNISRRNALRAYLFHGDEGSCVVIWTPGGETLDVRFDNIPDGIVFSDSMGNPMTPVNQNGCKIITLQDTPVFAVGRDIEPERMRGLITKADMKHPVSVTWSIRSENDHLVLDVDVTNNRDNTVDARIDTRGGLRHVPLKWGCKSVMDLGNIEPGNTVRASFPLRYGLDRNAEYKGLALRVMADGTPFEKNWLFWLISSRPSRTAVKLDGNLDDWQDVKPVSITTTPSCNTTRLLHQVRSGRLTAEEQTFEKNILAGEDDLSARVWSQWDAAGLHVACEVLDNSVEDGDRVEVFLDTDVPGDRLEEEMNKDDYVVTYTVGSNGNQAQLSGSGKTSTVPAAFRKTENGYVVEVTVPWERIGVTPETGMVFGFDVALTDMDKGSLHSQMVWSGSSFRWGNPLGFGVMTLGR